MRWLGLNWHDYEALPAPVADVAMDMMLEEFRRVEERLSEQPAISNRGIAQSGDDEIRWHKSITADGKVEKRREVSPGEAVIHNIFGVPRRPRPDQLAKQVWKKDGDTRGD